MVEKMVVPTVDRMADQRVDLTDSWIKMVSDLVHPMVPSS